MWVVARACVQAITIDEADTYLMWVAPDGHSPWSAASNNHVLNSLLMRVSTSVFGPCNFTLRAPAILGALIYIACAYWLCRMITRRLVVRLPLFICIVYNPFVMDYLVAARGYSLAAAFLVSGVTIAAYRNRMKVTPHAAAQTCGWCSACLSLSFAANFAFAFAALSVMALIGIWTWLLIPPRMRHERLRLLTACVLPGLASGFLFSIPVAAVWPRTELVYGTKSLGVTIKSVIAASLYRPNPLVLNPWLYRAAEFLKPWLFPALGAVFIWRLAVLTLDRPAMDDEHTRWLVALGTIAAGSALLTLGMHRLLYRLTHILIPMDRTALFLAPLCMLAVGAAAAIPANTRQSATCRRSLIALMMLVASYFIGCMRLSYFKEWYWDADTNRIYSILSYYNHKEGITDICTTWMCTSALNYYRQLSGRETFPPFVSDPGHFPPGKPIYVFFEPNDNDAVLGRNHLRIIYEGPVSHIAVAVRPEL